LDALDKTEGAAVEKSKIYPEFLTGRLMQRENVIAPETWKVGEAIDHLKKACKLPDQFYHVTLVDSRMHRIANVKLGRLMSLAREISLKDIKGNTLWIIPALQDEADVA
tara:strand:- start:142 stop:468 length:327 start_codon:yes stop_codon:yes gene_type:complete